MAKNIRQYATFTFAPFSLKQKQILTWALESSPTSDMFGVIADGSVRSGKSVSVSLGFTMWAMDEYEDLNFAICGKTIKSVRRNVIEDLKKMLSTLGYKHHDAYADNILTVTGVNKQGKVIHNRFHIFGGKDEGSQDLVQGITLAGVLFDEVGLMPQSFVNQATARCSITGSKIWFNCNPNGPFHWFKTEWIDKAEEKRLVYKHFTMDDNLSLSEEIKNRYKRMYSGVFYKRYILGLWVMAEGIIYSEFDDDKHCITKEQIPEDMNYYYIGTDYGITNPQVYLKAGIKVINGKPHIYIVDEYYNEGKSAKPKTDVQFVKDYKEFTKDTRITSNIIDPSAESLINLLRIENIHVTPAKNPVIDGINNVQMWFIEDRIHIVKDNCKNLVREIGSYVWDPKAQARGEDVPIKENDHALDALRYLINTLYPIRMPIRVRRV